MGFTRYWNQPRGISASAWGHIVADSRKLLAAIDVPLCASDAKHDQSKPPIVSGSEIRFNGRGDDAYETFALDRRPSPHESVKTERRPYDVVVTAVLVIARVHAAAEELSISCDDWDDDDDDDDGDGDADDDLDLGADDDGAGDGERTAAKSAAEAAKRKQLYDAVWKELWQPAIDLCHGAGITFPEGAVAQLRAALE